MTYIGKQLKRHRAILYFHISISSAWLLWVWMASLPTAWIGLFGLWWNLVGVWLVIKDKRLARKRSKFRLPEAWLWITALLGGGVGTWLAMKLYRHKTKHVILFYGMLGITGLYILTGLGLWWWLGGGGAGWMRIG